ncbi:PREDICTED: cytoskeleton-associated protein 4 [Gekko japonicus]|uniref:Cytoskeleton-associated protein 4 n=1 Tax=Gekko japonicus TaxID=146911 RepID=A0ABM1LAR4_GEKJA|nr:PREDICTED: cytoskeleton-associated protein 4 [Gekko japonicus]
MSSAKQRSNKGGGGGGGGGGSGSSPSEKGAHSSLPDDVAKKHPQQSQAHSKGAKGSSPAPGAGKASSALSLGKLFSGLFYLVLLAVAGLSGWGAHRLWEEVSHISQRQEGFVRQREELARTLAGVEQKIQSLQSAFGGFELTLKNSQQKQDITEKAVRQGESEINRISEVLQKLQNEILKDLSDGIHVVKDARERDFTSLENTVEERLTELTRSINDNIAEFTNVQKRSQEEINEVKANIALLSEPGAYKHELQALKSVVDEMQASMRAKEKAIESLQSTIDLMESDVLSEVKELVNLKQEHDKFKEAADTEHLSLQALEEKVLKAEETIASFPDELQRLSEDLLHIKTSANVQESYSVPEDILQTLQKDSERYDSRFRTIEEKLQSLSSTAQHVEMEESFASKYESKLAALEEGIGSLRDSLESDARSLTDTVRSLSESQLSMYSDIDELRRSMSDLSNNADALDRIQNEVRALLDREKPPMAVGQSKHHLEELSSLKSSVGELRSSVDQAESDLKMLRTAVDSLVAYSVKIETNQNDVQSVKTTLDDLRNDLDRLFVKVEKIHEKI